MSTQPGDYETDSDPARVDRDALWQFLSTEAYWARWRSRDDVERQLASAWRVTGCYTPEGSMIGFARATSDGVSFAHLADVYVLAEHRGRGLGRALIREMIDNGPGADFLWTLHTHDAHSLYETFGFVPADHTCMERPSGRPGGH